MNKKWYNADNKKSLVQFRKHYASVRKKVQDIVKQQDQKKSLTTQNNPVE